MKAKLKILLQVVLGLIRRPFYLIRFIYIWKKFGLVELKKSMLLFVDGGSTSILTTHDCLGDIGTQIFLKEQVEFSVKELSTTINGFQQQVLISIILPTYKTPIHWLNLCVESVCKQIYPYWELCIVDDASNSPELLAALQELSGQDPRIKVHFLEQNSGIAAASNAALLMAQGEFIALLDHDDELTPDALFWVLKAINDNNRLDYIYSNEAKIDVKGQLTDFYFKPDWDPELLINSMYTGHLSVYRKALVDKLGGFRSEYDFSQDYDLALRVTAVTSEITHIDRVLYLWRKIEGSSAQGDKPFARISNLAALAAVSKQKNLDARVIEYPCANKLQLKISAYNKVSIIVPSDSSKNIKTTIHALLTKTDYPNFEIIIVTKTALIKKLVLLYPYNEDIRFCPYDLAYNFSDKCNVGAQCAQGEFVVFYNDDVAPKFSNWLQQLLQCFELEGVGGVSPKLLYENETIQYAGMYTAVREYDFVTTTLNGMAQDTSFYFSYVNLLRDVSILSGACLIMRKSLFDVVGGFDAMHTPARHSDVDLSFKIREQGLRCVYTPYSVLWHIGNHSWHTSAKKEQSVLFCLKRWGEYMSYDPYVSKKMQAIFRRNLDEFLISAKNNPDFVSNKPYVLLVSHDLSVSGAPRALYLMALALNETYHVMVAAPKDGPMRQLFEEENIPVIIEDSILKKQARVFDVFAQDFDLIIANTIVCSPVVKRLQERVKCLWWIHESKSVGSYFKSFAPRKKVLNRCQHVYTVSDYAKQFLLPFNTQVKLLPLGIPDQFANYVPNKESQEFIVFTMVGTIERRKAQDILVRAIKKLPEIYRKQAKFKIIGRANTQDFFNKFQTSIADYDCIEYYCPMDNSKVLEIINTSNVLVCISRDDPMPIVIMEAWMLNKPCILSDRVGESIFLEEGKNGFLTKAEAVDELVACLQEIIAHRESLQKMGNSMRDTYLQEFTFEKFAERCLKVVDEIISIYP